MVESVVIYGPEGWDVSKRTNKNYWQQKCLCYEAVAWKSRLKRKRNRIIREENSVVRTDYIRPNDKKTTRLVWRYQKNGEGVEVLEWIPSERTNTAQQRRGRKLTLSTLTFL